MNPLDLPSPQFLLLYAVAACWLVGVLVLYRYMVGSAGGPPVVLSDPYEIAFLRGGRQEALHLATLSLVERGYLTVDEDRVRREKDPLSEKLENPLEVALLAAFDHTSRPEVAFKNDAVERECARCRASLTGSGAWLNDRDHSRVEAYRWIVMAGLVALAGAKVAVALSRGRTDVLYLIVLAALFCLAARLVYRDRRAARGSQYLRDLEILLADSRAAEPNGKELLMLGAVMGVTALPAMMQSYSVSLFQPARRDRPGQVSIGGDDTAL